MPTFTEPFTTALSLTWTNVAHTLSVASGGTQGTASGVTGSSFHRAEHDVGSTDMYAELTWSQGATDAARWLGVVTRFSATSHTCYALEVNDSGDRFQLYKVVNGVGTTISGVVATPVAPPGKIRLESQGSTHRCYWGGQLVGTYTDTQITSGQRGGINSFNSDNVLRFDDFRTGPYFVDIAPVDVAVEAPPVTTLIQPVARLAPVDIAVSAPPVAVPVIKTLAPVDVAVGAPPVTVARIYDVTPVDTAVNVLSVATITGLRPVEVRVEVLPVQVAYGSGSVTGRGGIVAVPRIAATRFIAQSILTGEFLHWDLPIEDSTVTYTLSGPQVIAGALRPDVRDLRELIAMGLEPWSCWVHVETDNLIRASGILQPLQVNGDELALEAVGPGAYLSGLPYLGEYSRIQIDPADAVREIWRHVQAYPDGNLGVTVRGTTPVRIGQPATTETTTGADGQPQTREVEAQPYELVWWEAPDCGSEVNNLARETPFDWVERCTWDATRTAVDHWIDIGYPRVGARRDDLRFATGENVLNVVPVEETDDLYASQVVLLGKGEGRQTVRGYAGRPLRKRLRRAAVIQDSTVPTTARANAFAGDELERRQALIDVTDLEVDARHINAQFGSYSVGDDIPLDVEVDWLGRLQQWERVLSITYSPDADAVRLQLRRSEAFRYGNRTV